jgi:hypothetical protein
MGNFGIVINHDEHEYSVYPDVQNELSARDVIQRHQKEGRKIEFSILHAADKDEVVLEAEAMNEGYQYHWVEDTLRRYAPPAGRSVGLYEQVPLAPRL